MIARLLRISGSDAPRLRRSVLLWVLVAVLEGVGFVLLVPVLRRILDGDPAGALRWAAAMFGVLVVYGVARYVAQLEAYLAAIGLSKGLFQRIGDKVATLPLGWFGPDRVGSVGRLASKGVVDVMGVPAHLLRPVITAAVTPLTVILLMFFFDWRLALAAVATAPVAWLMAKWVGWLVKNSDHHFNGAAVDAGSRLVEFSQTQAVLRASGRTTEGFDLLDDALLEHRDAGRSLMKTAVPAIMGFAAIVQVAFLIVLFVGVAIATGGGSLDAPELIALLVLVVRSIDPLVAAADISGGLEMAANTLDRADQLIGTPTLAEPADARSPANSAVTFESVSFGYDDHRVLHDIDLTVSAGSMTAIVGPSGSGKTTMARLVARFWDVDDGAVRVGGVDVRDITTEDLMRELSIVFQDTYLFAGTIADNLRLAAPEATQEQLDRVAELTRLDDVIQRLPGGWEADVGERGGRLSGGERQRVSIARALLKDSPIVLLDEATAAIDPLNEQAIQNAIDALRGERTIIVIAHRLSTVINADQIVVLDDGRIAEQGTHAELLDVEGRYAEFWRERERASGWRLAAGSTT